MHQPRRKSRLTNGLRASKLLNIHILNVGHGDSIILEYEGGTGKTYGLINSNVTDNEDPRALVKLRELDVKELSFICLTHPHRDHYRGLHRIMTEYRGRVAQLYTFPIGGLSSRRIKALAKKFREIGQLDDPVLTRDSTEFARILMTADTEFVANGNWLECAGAHSQITPPGFQGVEISTILPPNKARGYYIQQIELDKLDVMQNPKDNDLSIAFYIFYGNAGIVLGGDGSLDNWLWHQQWHRRGGKSIVSGAVKLPHHGSERDCSPSVMGYLFDDSIDRYAFISADGQSHPSDGVLRWLRDHGIRPYCTNLSRGSGATVRRLVNVEGLDPVLGRWINQLAEGQDVVQVCQGDIVFSIAGSGRTRIATQYSHTCGCGTEIDALLAG